MDRRDLRIVFMGTPEFAVASLDALVCGGYNVVGVVTMPDKPIGRGYKLQGSAVKEYAVSKGLRVLQPERLKDETFVEELRALKADLQIVVAFRMLPEVVWAMPRFGTFNLHASLLPQYRGAAPINWAVINGDKETGVTTFFLQHEIDTGNIILQERLPILPSDNVGSVYDKLMRLGAEVLVRTVDCIIDGSVSTRRQNESGELRPAPKIFKETCQIDWRVGGERVHNLVRGMSPYPGAWTRAVDANGEELVIKVFETRFEPMCHGKEPGTVMVDKDSICVAAADGWVRILELQMPGKRRMAVADFMRGYKDLDKLRML